MAFTGRDYHAAFEEACEKLPYETDKDQVRSELEGIEWILWEADRGVFFQVSVIVAALVTLLPFYLLVSDKTLTANLVAIAFVFLIATALYWLLRLAFRLEISAHVKGRRFGSGGIG